MAYTYSYQDALNAARPLYGREIDASQLVYVLNNAITTMWEAYDWRGTLANLEPFWLVGLQQDYGPPFYVIPSDFWGFREVYLVQPQVNLPTRAEVHVTSNIQLTSGIGLPQAICYRPAASSFRVWPTPPGGLGLDFMIDGTYKKRPPKVVRSNLADTILWDDVYFNCFVQALGWASLAAGGRREEAAKQELTFRRTLAMDTATENQELGEPVVYPSEGYNNFSVNTIQGGYWF